MSFAGNLLSRILSVSPALFIVCLAIFIDEVNAAYQAQTSPAQDERPTVIVVVGAEGSPEYGKAFRQWAQRWEKAAKTGGANYTFVDAEHVEDTGGKAMTDRDLLHYYLTEAAKQKTTELWLVLIGHGTFDGREAKFNLRGPDLSTADLVAWLAPLTRPVAVINCSSSSGPFLKPLAGPHRVVITATRSGAEQNYARFGDYLSKAIADPTADFDKDGQTSLLEAYLAASRQVTEFYTTEARLATEHALLDDTGDGLGTPANWFRGVRATVLAKDSLAHDGHRAHQFHLIVSPTEENLPQTVRVRRNELELEVIKLRETKAKLPEDDYYQQLETLLLQLARLYADAVKT